MLEWTQAIFRKKIPQDLLKHQMRVNKKTEEFGLSVRFLILITGYLLDALNYIEA